MSRPISLAKVNHTDRMPRYIQARDILLEAIRSGRFAPGCKLPSTKEISAFVDVSLITAHKALEELVEMGWLRREVGRGTYVREDVDVNGRAAQQLSIGLLFDHREHVNINDYYHSTLIDGLRRASRDDPRRTEFFFHDQLDLRDSARKDVGAICIHPPVDAQPEVERLARHHPVVVLGGSFPGQRVACVDCDNEAGARAAVRHLLTLGHRRFMVLSGPMNLSNSRDRALGAAQELAANDIALADADRPVSRDAVVLDDQTRARIERRLLSRDRPTAIVAGGFYLALELMQAARRVGLTVPGDVSIVGFDDPPSAALLNPALTTVRQPLAQMAAAAYQLVCDGLLRGSASMRSLLLSTELVERESSGPYPRTR